MIFYDTECVGFHGVAVLIQWAEDDGPVHLHDVWNSPVSETLELIEWMMDNTVVGFNLAFDHFHLSKLYGMLKLWSSTTLQTHQHPIDHIQDIADIEEMSMTAYCLKPRGVIDLFLHARKGPFQSLMERGNIIIRRVPSVLAGMLADTLTAKTELDDIYFTKSKGQRWRVKPCENPRLSDVCLELSPSTGLKPLTRFILGNETLDIGDLLPPVKNHQSGAAPFCRAELRQDTGRYSDRNRKGARWNSWDRVLKAHVNHWANDMMARKYARDDVLYTRTLYKYFACLGHVDDAKKQAKDGSVHDFDMVVNDYDSVLACQVGAVRWRGYSLDIPALESLLEDALELVKNPRINYNATTQVVEYLCEKLTPFEVKILSRDGKFQTGKKLLESMEKMKITEVCPHCDGMLELEDGTPCDKCKDGVIDTNVDHPVAARAREVIIFREQYKKIHLIEKLIHAKRFHASYNVIGTLSGRMSGSDSLNPQGINREGAFRSAFTMADEGFSLCGGDFDGFETTIMIAQYKDSQMKADYLLERSGGPKIYAQFGTMFFPGNTAEDIMATKGLPGSLDLYSRAKAGTLAIFYGGEEHTLTQNIGIDIDSATRALRGLAERYPDWAAHRERLYERFCSMTQPGGIGTQVVWKDPATYSESMTGYRRSYDIENQICAMLYEIADKPPKAWSQIKERITRRDKEQTVCGALRSALYGCCFGMQASNMRSAANHEIQATGGEITKKLQVALWEIQPIGIHRWEIVPMNVHDEVMAPVRHEHKHRTKEIVDSFIKEQQALVPLLGMDWHLDMQNWGEK